MLRHIRMMPTAKEIPRSEGRIFGFLQDLLFPFYRYRIPHTPTPRDRVCTCAYPLFTLRSSRRSLYDEPASMAAVQDTVYVDSTGKSTSRATNEADEAAAAAVVPSTAVVSAASSSGPASSTTTAASTDPLTRMSGSGTTAIPSASSSGTSPASGSHASAFLSSFGNLPSLKARWAVRRQRRGGRLTTPPQSTETCYRCDICDGLQRSADDVEAHREGVSVAAAVGQAQEEVIEADDEDVEEGVAASADTSGDERYGFVTSTDIANTAMEDADVAELRHLDPFHVEVFGRPSWGALLKRATREVQGQLNRCGLRSRDASRYAAQATANSDVAKQAYCVWVRAEAQRVREAQRRSMQPVTNTSTRTAGATSSATVSNSEVTSPSSSSTTTTPLTLSFEQRAIIKGKLDTLHIAAYLARYAVAAYGLPYELNFFTSVRELAKLMAEPHSRYVCANSEEQLEAMRRMLQGEEPDALLECVASRYSLRVGQTCWSLFLDHAAQRVILSFRGSLTAADIVVDVMEGYANVMLDHTHTALHRGESAPSSFSASQPHKVCTAIPLGFYEAAVEAGTQLLPILHTIHAQYGSYTLCITGHSLGGIEASLFHLLYCGPWRATLHSSSSLLRRTKTLRCPSAVGVESISLTEFPAESTGSEAHVPFAKVITCTFAAAPVIEKRVVSVVNTWLDAEERRSGSRLIAMGLGMDWVTRLQVHTLRETFTKSYSAASPTTSEQVDSEEQIVSDAATMAPLPVLMDVASVSDKTVVPVLAVPGSMYNITAGKRRRYLLAVPPAAAVVRQQIVLSAEAVLQHFPCLYLRSLAELLNRYEAKWSSVRAVTAAPSTPDTPLTTSMMKRAEEKHS